MTQKNFNQLLKKANLPELQSLSLQREFDVFKLEQNARRLVEFKDIMSEFLNRFYSFFTKINDSISLVDFKKSQLKRIKIAGVYGIFVIKEDKVINSYIGESNHIYKRWAGHVAYLKANKKSSLKIYRNLKSLLAKNIISQNDIHFVILELEDDGLKRLLKETYYILLTRSKFLSLNSKYVHSSIRCANGHSHLKHKIKYFNLDEKNLTIKTEYYVNCKICQWSFKY